MSGTDVIRLVFFVGILGGVALWEVVAPRRKPLHAKTRRWTSNLGIVAIYTVLLRILFPVMPVAMALVAQRNGWGFLNVVDIPLWAKVVAGSLMLDFVIYLQHVMFHAVPILWQFHMMHHEDLDFDLTTGLRFHPVEIVISTLIKLSAVVALGAPALSVVIFEVLLNGTSMFNHGNIRLPLGADRILRLFVVTPDMHRVHHSVIIRETNSNFGFNLPWWDRLLGTYRDQPSKGHTDMTIGLSHIRDPKYLDLRWMLALPFTEDAGRYALGRSAREP